MMLKRILIILAVIGIPSTFLSVALSFSFYTLSTPSPDPGTGHTYPFNMHGSTIYVWPFLGEAQTILFWVGWVCIVALALTSFGKSQGNSN